MTSDDERPPETVDPGPGDPSDPDATVVRASSSGAHPGPDRRVVLTALTYALAAAVCGLGAVGLIGWHLASPTLIQVSPAFAPMQYNTALGMFACGLGLFLARHGARRLSLLAAGVTIALGVLTLFQYQTGVDLGIDEWFMRAWVVVQTSHPGRMAPNTALCFVLVGTGLALLLRDLRSLAGIAGALVLGLGAVAFLGYVTALETAYGWGSLTAMAVHTSLGFMAAGTALVMLAWQRGFDAAQFPDWLPAAAALATIALTVALWQAVAHEQRKEALHALDVRAQALTARFEAKVRENVQALDRMASRVARHGIADGFWDADARRYVVHEPAYQAIGILDAAMELQRVFPPAARTVLEPSTNAARALRRQAVAQVLRDRGPVVSWSHDRGRGENSIHVYAPIVDGGTVSGHVVGVLRLPVLVDEAFGPVAKDRVAYALVHRGRQIHAWMPDDRAAVDWAAGEAEVRLGDSTWTLRLRPRRDYYLRDLASHLPGVLLAAGLLLAVLLFFSLRLAKNSRRSQLDLERLRRHYALVLDSAGEGIYGLDMQGRTTFANAAATAMVQWNVDELIGKTQHDLIHHSRPDGSHYPTSDCPINSSLYDGLVHRVDSEYFWRKDGTSFPVDYTSTPITVDGVRRGAVVVFRDITERKKAEEELRLARETLEQRVDERTAEMRQVNEQLREEIDQRERAEVELKRTAQALRARNEFKRQLEELSDLMRGDPPLNALCERVLGHVSRCIGASVGAIYVLDQGGLSLSGQFGCADDGRPRDRFAPGEGLVGQVARDGVAQVIDPVPYGYLTVRSGLGDRVPNRVLLLPLRRDQEVKGVLELGTLHEFDEHHTEFLGQALERIAIAIESAQARERMAELLAQSQSQSEELQSQQDELRATNEQLEEQAQRLRRSEEALTAKSDALESVNELLEDRTRGLERQKQELEQAGAELEAKAQQLEASSRYKSEFLANMSHELRTPLNSLLILSQLLADNEEGRLDDEQVECARVIHGSGRDLLALINDILDLSKVEAGKMVLEEQDVEIADLCEELSSQFLPLAQRKGLEFSVETAPDAPARIRSDRQRIAQVVRNLLSNAIKFTEAGWVKVSIRGVSVADGSRCLAIAVSDSGPGISAANREAIFGAFQQGDGSISRRYGGTGLGLTISRQIATLLGGDLDLDGRVGEGSTFTFTVPVEGELSAPVRDDAVVPMPAEAAAPPGEAVQPPAPGVRCVLLAEDNEGHAEVLAALVRRHGYHCIVTATGGEALDAARRFQPDGIVLDLDLPDIDGLQVLATLKEDERTRRIPVHAISGRGDTAPLRHGAVGVLPKPASAADIEAIFADLASLRGDAPRRVLVVEDDEANRQAVVNLVGNRQVETDAAGTAAEARAAVLAGGYDCVILDLGLPDMNGLDLLDALHEACPTGLPPIVVHTARDLTREEHLRLRRHTDSIVVKGAGSPERLLDEVSLFLHSVDSGRTLGEWEAALDAVDVEQGFHGRRVLLVDDDLRNTFALTRALHQTGVDIEVVDNGQEALDALAAGGEFDLVLMDVMMPVMDGLEAMRRIRAQSRFRNLPIIALTAKAMKEDRDRCIEAGADDYITKPVAIDRLLSIMRVWLQGTPVRRRPAADDGPEDVAASV